MSPTYDAIVVGYGPVGATTANLLGQRGWRVAVVERDLSIYDKPRAITGDQEAMRVFQSVGLADEIAKSTIPHPGTEFVGVDGQPIKYFNPAPPPHLLGWEPNFMFFQPELESTLRRGVDRYPDVDVLLGQEVSEFRQAGDTVYVTVQQRDGATGQLSASWLLACDGARSAIRRQLRSSIEDLQFDEWWVVVDTTADDAAVLPDQLTQYCWPHRPATYIVGPGKLRRWEIKVLPDEDPRDFEDESRLREILSLFVDVDHVAIDRVAIYRFHALVVDGWRTDRIFLVGDAAHQMPPFLGQGMCAGIRDAVNLAWKLDAVHRLGGTDALLDTYEQERKPHVRTVVETAKDFGLIIGELDPAQCVRRDARLEAELRSGRTRTVRQDYIPRITAGLIDLDPAGQPNGAAGQILPQPTVRHPSGQQLRLDDVLGPGFALLLTDGWSAELEPEVRASLAQLGTTIVRMSRQAAASTFGGDLVVVDASGLLLDWAQHAQADAIIARPDRYVYGTAATPDKLRALVGDLRHGVLGVARRTRLPANTMPEACN